MEYQALSHEDSKLVYMWLKPNVTEKLERLSKYCRMTKGQLIEQVIEDFNEERFDADLPRMVYIDD